MNKTTYNVVILATALFSCASYAEMDNVGDILTGNGKIAASLSTPYVWANSKPQSLKDYILYGSVEIA